MNQPSIDEASPPADEGDEQGRKRGEAGKPSFQRLHDAAEAARESTYRDPKTGYGVTTTVGHLRRGYCCGAACRHCPFEWASVTFANMPRGRTPPPPVSLDLMRAIAPELLRP